jgi:hypothetical protein
MSETTYLSTLVFPAPWPCDLPLDPITAPPELEVEQEIVTDLNGWGLTIWVANGAGQLVNGSSTITYNVKARYRLRHIAEGTGYLKVWISEAVGVRSINSSFQYEWEYTTTELEPYVWTGTLSDPLGSIFSEENQIGEWGDWLYADTPATPWGATTRARWITNYSYVPGYEPDLSNPENWQQKGFPDPAWALL